jgi:hypothetical protein
MRGIAELTAFDRGGTKRRYQRYLGPDVET